MNSNETVRNISTEHAEALSAVYPMLINSQKYNSFSMYMLEVNWDTLFSKWIAQGGNPVDLIEPTDGFHPSTTGSFFFSPVVLKKRTIQALVDVFLTGSQLWAQEVWSEMQTKWPNLIGPVNPHNDEIRRLFGDQGGY
jgi:acyloxyacyl hydrolase